jgi:circadian clock protein KaiB
VSAPRESTADFEAIVAASQASAPLALRLYVAGSSARSTRAIQNARDICEHHFKDRYTLEIIDIFQQPELAREDAVLAVPVLIRRRPRPMRRFLGDLSDRARVVNGLDAPGR